ncbi:sterol O-acyltransferase 2 isoform X1 [Meriones unguiculatus]|uniref:sterol O-acyltransferase 2 isoform X1 n=1 Tax=Meriones unguiculatus TaxID=10047 RepID=UPI00293E5094|nr:sterol O-acyltransferase 2 isoform X1 [Meriones unguiculatus]
MEPKGTQLRRRDGPEKGACGDGNTKNHRTADLVQWTRHMEAVKSRFLEQAQRQLAELLDRALWEAEQAYPQQDRPLPAAAPGPTGKTQEFPPGKRKVFVTRKSLLDELMEVQHFRTIYHMFVAGLCVLVISTLAIDFIDEGRLVLEFDLLIFSFGQLPLALMTWVPMFLSTLLVPYQSLWLWARPRAGGAWTLGAGLGCALLAAHAALLCVLPVHVAVKWELPPASRCVLVFEQVRLLMKSYSFLRETVPGVLCVRGKGICAPSFSSYLYFLFCPTLIYRETYPRTPCIRWNYVAKNFAQALGCVLYACFILGRLCVPVFAHMSQEPFSTRALLLSVLHATGPGIFMLLLIFFAFLHCWLNAFAEMLRFGDRMFYRDWWNSTSFSNYYRTWNVVVHDWLYSYVYQDGLWLLGGHARGAAMVGVFLVSAVVHEYIFCFVLGFFYPVMLMLFLVFGGLLNFTMNDRHTGPAWNVLMWTLLFLGQGIQVSLYCQEWYARRHCPLPQTTFWGLVTPRSWSCHP